MSTAPRPMHVERTEDPAVLRWVCHDDELAAAPPGQRVVPGGAPLGSLVADGAIVEVTVRRGNVLVRASAPEDWAVLAPVVRDAIAAELDAMRSTPDHWLLIGAAQVQPLPTVAELQRIVERSAGAITATHGGAMTVVAVEPGVVRLRPQGACDGCRQSDDTALAIIAPAVRAEYPQLVDVIVEPTGTVAPTGPAPKTDWVRFGRR